MAAPTQPPSVMIPDAIRVRNQWVLYKLVPKEDQEKPTKIPVRPDNGNSASTTDSKTWGTFAQALAAQRHYKCNGPGFVFTAGDPFCGIDLDGCVNPQSGEIAPLAMSIVNRFNSYAEISPSGTGIHIFVEGKLPGKGRKNSGLGIEMYDQGRYFTVTGKHLAGTPFAILPRQAELDDLYAEFFPPEVVAETPVEAPLPVIRDMADQELLDLASKAVNGVKFWRLYRGDKSDYCGPDGQPDDSSADLALCNLLAFYTRDPLRTDSLFRRSGLMRAKWDEQRGDATYGQLTISKAFQGRTEFYTPRSRKEGKILTLPPPPAISGTAALATAYAEPEPQTEDAPGPAPLRYQFISDLEVQNQAPLTWTVEKVIPAQSQTVIYGDSFVGKTFVTLDLCCHICEGVNWHGRKVTQGPVYYIVAEGIRGMQLRLKAWKIARGLPLDYSLDIHFLGMPVPVLDTDAQVELIRALKAAPEPPALVVFDTLGRCLTGGEENSNDDMHRLANAGGLITSEVGCGVVWVHHKGKTGPTMRGGSALFGDVDTVIEVTKEENEPTVTLINKKQKDGADTFPTIMMRLKPVLVDVQYDLTSCIVTPMLATEVGDILPPLQKKLLFALHDHLPDGMTSTDWQQASGLAKQTFMDNRNALLAQDFVLSPSAPAKGALYRLSSKGMDWCGLVRRTNAVPITPYRDDDDV